MMNDNNDGWVLYVGADDALSDVSNDIQGDYEYFLEVFNESNGIEDYIVESYSSLINDAYIIARRLLKVGISEYGMDEVYNNPKENGHDEVIVKFLSEDKKIAFFVKFNDDYEGAVSAYIKIEPAV